MYLSKTKMFSFIIISLFIWANASVGSTITNLHDNLTITKMSQTLLTHNNKILEVQFNLSTQQQLPTMNETIGLEKTNATLHDYLVNDNPFYSSNSIDLVVTGDGSHIGLYHTGGGREAWECVATDNYNGELWMELSYYLYDVFQVQDHTTQSGSIINVTVLTKNKNQSGHAGYGKHVVYIGSTPYYGSEFNITGGTDWYNRQTKKTVFINNPATSNSWSWSDVDNAQYGIALENGGTCVYLVVIVYYINNVKPVANFTYSPNNPKNISVIHFTDTSYDPDGSIVSWWWDFGDHYFSDLQNPVHCYYENGVYTVKLTVKDDYGMNDTIQKTIIVSNPPQTPTLPSGPTQGIINQNYSYSTSAIEPDGELVQYRFDWNASGSHDYSQWTNLGISGHVDSLSHSWGKTGTYMVKAQARDENGFESSWSNGLTVAITTGIENLDQQQTKYTKTNQIFISRWSAQSFKPTIGVLTRVELYVGKTGSPTNNLVVSIRSSLTGSDLSSVAKSSSSISSGLGWVEFDLPDISVTPGNTYYIVVRTSGGTSINNYLWGYGYYTPYINGVFWMSTNSGSSWIMYPLYDFCFKTYGL